MLNRPIRLYATFDNIGGLKARSPVSIGGVVVGRVADITLDPKTYLPRVTLEIEQRYNHILDTSSLSDSYFRPAGRAISGIKRRRF
ncbi:MlaD family protein [Klebsiella pneumoniae]|nr:MlaD family protein [Klebsiella pneumoniae]